MPRPFHFIKNLYLRCKFGSGCCDTYSLYILLSKKILPHLKMFKERTFSFPIDDNINNIDEWKEILNKMIWSFESVLADDDGEVIKGEDRHQYYKRRQEGFELFGKYFRNLWI